MSLRWGGLSSVFLRYALGLGFLSAVADRLGLWGAFGQPNVEWGNFSRFLEYTHRLNWYLPAGIIPPLGVIATSAEILFGLLLLVGWHTRAAALFEWTPSTVVRGGNDACVRSQGAPELCRLHRGGRGLGSRKLRKIPVQRR
jgi:hypothetical protein